MADVQVNYTHKKGDHYNPHERIIGVAGDLGNGWYLTESQVIYNIDNNIESYFVNVNGVRADVEVAEHLGRRYIKTKPDGYAPNNLLALPEPPARLIT
ncbi:MAG TPA: DUF3892 domain-containing protein [Candidatus Saccharimonadales bacterium]|jgi:hypothetical protein